MRRLLTHLAQFSSFSKQGEVLCTRGLEYLLEDQDAKAAFLAHIQAKTGVLLSDSLAWRAEARQRDLGRPDLEAIDAQAKPVVKVEAKLGATLGEEQLRSYAADLQSCSGAGVLLVLVPRYRIDEAQGVAAAAFATETSGCAVAVVCWEDILDGFDTLSAEPFAGDLAQFRAMYRALSGDDVEPITSNRDWKVRENAFVAFVDRATRRLRPQKVAPMALDERGVWEEGGYLRRYICLPLGSKHPCFSVGVRNPFENYDTPVWLRFHKVTPMFPVIRDRLRASHLSTRLVLSAGHIWLPLDVPLNAPTEGVIDALVAQTEEVIRIVYRPVEREAADSSLMQT